MNDSRTYDGLTKIIWGYFFIYFDFNINTVSILPSFVGYFLLLLAIEGLACEEQELRLLRPFATVLLLWHGAKWLLSWGSVSLDGMLWVADIVVGLINLYFHFQLLTNLASIAGKYQSQEDALDQKLLLYRTVQTVLLTAVMIIGKLSEVLGEYWAVISIGLAIVYIIVGILLIKALFTLRKRLSSEESL